MSAAHSSLEHSPSAPLALRGRDPWPWRGAPLFPFPAIKERCVSVRPSPVAFLAREPRLTLPRLRPDSRSDNTAPQLASLAPLLTPECRRNSADSFEESTTTGPESRSESLRGCALALARVRASLRYLCTRLLLSYTYR